MSCTPQKGSELPEALTMASTDFVIGVVDEGGTLVTKKIRKDKFSTDIPGPPGPQGPAGPVGPQGPTGPAGDSSEWTHTVERMAAYHQASATANVIIGDSFTTAVAPAIFTGDDNTPQGRELQTSTALDNSNYVDSGAASYQFRTIRTQMVYIGRPNQTVNHRAWIGFTAALSATHFAGGITPAQNYAAFRFSAGTDTNWQAVVCDGTNTTTVDTGIPPSATVAETFRVEWSRGGSEVRFYIGATLVATINTNLPASGTGMRAIVGLTNLSAGVLRSLILNIIKIRESLINP